MRQEEKQPHEIRGQSVDKFQIWCGQVGNLLAWDCCVDTYDQRTCVFVHCKRWRVDCQMDNEVQRSRTCDITVESFTPKCLAAVQHQCTQHVGERGKRYSRQYCNTLVKHIKQMFRWGVRQELVSPVTADALKYVEAFPKFTENDRADEVDK